MGNRRSLSQRTMPALKASSPTDPRELRTAFPAWNASDQVSPLKKNPAAIALNNNTGGARVLEFHIQKQITFDLCWAAVALSAARFRGIDDLPDQSALVAEYPGSSQRDCPCSAHPGDGGLLLWCVDCAFNLLGVRYTTLSSLPTFDRLCTDLIGQYPLCVLRSYSAGAHYVVVVGAYHTTAGGTMISIADPDPGQPEVRDIAYRELLEGDGRTIAWYRF